MLRIGRTCAYGLAASGAIPMVVKASPSLPLAGCYACRKRLSSS